MIQHFIPATAPEHTLKKSRAVVSQDLFNFHRQSKEVIDSVLSTSPPVPQATPERWLIPSSPAHDDAEVRLWLDTQAGQASDCMKGRHRDRNSLAVRRHTHI